MTKATAAEKTLYRFAVESGAASLTDAIILPGGGVTITATAEELFKRIGPTHTLFVRGGAIMSISENDGALELEVLSPVAARSRFESYAEFHAWRVGRGLEQQVLKPTVIAQEMAAALLESKAARKFLPTITGLINCPVILATDDGAQIVGKGFHSETGLFITDGHMPPHIELSEARTALKELVSEVDFQSSGDRSRTVASFIAPALKFGEHLKGNVPVAVVEANDSQAGKTYLQKLVAAVYNETPALVTCRTGGVGSVDESVNAKLIAGRPFILLDNFRGKFDSPHIEALLTAEKSFPVRLPYCREVDIDPTCFFIMLTSNGVEMTRDFANRCNISRISKRDGYQFRQYSEGDLLDHVRACQPYYLGAVFAIIREWIARGRPRSGETRHDFREWAQTLDWIVQNLLGEAPLMDGHQAAQQRVSNPDLTFLRKLTIAVADEGRSGETLNASALYEIADRATLDIPGLRQPDEDKGKRQIGSVMARLFKAADRLSVDGFAVTRDETEAPRSDGGGKYPSKTYQFMREAG